MLIGLPQRWRWQPERYVALKITTCEFIGQAAFKLKMSQHLAWEDPQHQGTRFGRTVFDSFKISGSHGMHVCLVYEAMRLTLSRFKGGLRGPRFPLLLLKACIRLLLLGFDYLHWNVR